MARFSVDLEELLAGGRSDDGVSLHPGADADVGALFGVGVGNDWHGDAASAQEAAQQQWDDGAQQLRDALAQLRDVAEQAHSNYSNAASTNTRMWG